MKKFLLNVLLAGLIMNFVYPEILFQYNKIKLNGSIIDQLKAIDVNELILNSENYFNDLGNFNESFIAKKADEFNNPSVQSTKNSDQKITAVSLQDIPDGRKKILIESQKYIGLPYSFGSKDPSTGFDCSGYVSYVYEKSIGHKLPAGSKNQFASGEGLLVNYDQLKPGDLMFFSHNGRSIQHVGIYVGDDRLIHAPRTGRRISIDEVGRYWKQKFVKGKAIVK